MTIWFRSICNIASYWFLFHHLDKSLLADKTSNNVGVMHHICRPVGLTQLDDNMSRWQTINQLSCFWKFESTHRSNNTIILSSQRLYLITVKAYFIVLLLRYHSIAAITILLHHFCSHLHCFSWPNIVYVCRLIMS